MKDPQIVVITNNSLLRCAARYFLKSYIQPENLYFLDSAVECINGNLNPEFIIMDSAIIPIPMFYSLQRILEKNKKGLIMLIETVKVDESVDSIIYNRIHATDTEKMINEKVKSFINDNEKRKNVQETLSEREKEIVELVAKGFTNKEIADSLFISPHTVVTHRKNITAKLGIKTIAGLTVYAVLNGIIDAGEVNE